jgi:hypothetical protein
MEDYYPKRLAWIQDTDICMFCKDPKGSSSTYACADNTMGFICCANCESKMEEAIIKWNNHYDIRYLMNADNLRIRRSSGEIEEGWRMFNPININCDDPLQKRIFCVNENKELTKWCKLDDLMKLNPLEDLRNLCVNCGQDMGIDNPRQLCCKTYCPNEEGEFLKK